MAGAGSVNLRTRVRVGAVPGVDPDHWKRFPERRDPGAAGTETWGEAGGDGLGPLAEALLPERRPAWRVLEAERRARANPGAARPGAWRLRGWRRRRQFGSQALASRRAQAAPSSERTSSSTAPFSRAPGCRRWAQAPVRGLGPPAGGDGFGVVVDSGAFWGLAPLRPQHVVKPPAFRWLAVGGAGGSEHFRVTSRHRFFLFHSRAPTLALCTKSVPTYSSHLGTCGIGCDGSACPVLPATPSPRQVPTSELDTCRS